MQSLSEMADILIGQKKGVQKQYDDLMEINKIMVAKFREVSNKLSEWNQENKCKPMKQYKIHSFSKNDPSSSSSYFSKIDFAKTFINSIEELELKKVEEEEPK